MSEFRKRFQKLIEESYIPYNANPASRADIWHQIYRLVLPNIPDKLFRYRAMNDYSFDEFKNGRISLCHAGMFPDKYDSYLYVNHNKIRDDLQTALRDALRICLTHISQHHPDIRAEKATKICYYRECGYTDEQIIDKILEEEYPVFIEQIETAVKQRESRFRSPRNSAKIGCFTESVQSKYMWDRYGGGYKGFALEYDLRNCILKYNKLNLNVNLFPIMYTDQRPDVTLDEGNIHTYEFFKQAGDKLWFEYLCSHIHLDQIYWYRAYLYKDRREYEHEHEWRMLYYNLDNEDDYESIPDVGSLTAIYYGPDMEDQERNKLHTIALSRGIKEYTISIDNDSPKYDLKITPYK